MAISNFSVCRKAAYQQMVIGDLQIKVPFLWSPYVIGQTIIFLPCDFYLSSFFFFLA